jgi:hypothetical protein
MSEVRGLIKARKPIKTYKDLEIYQLAYELSLVIVNMKALC